jgi:hypothetical protein
LRFADKLVDLIDLSARQLLSLSTRVYDQEKSAVVGTSSSISRSGPFIYNPFEARRVAAIEAEASRAVTWVCGETAHVSITLKNQVHAHLSVEIVAVAVFSAGDQEQGMWSAVIGQSENDDEGTGAKSSSPPASSSGASFVEPHRVRATLHAVNRVATTLSQTILLPSRGSGGSMTVDVSLVPRRPGPLHMYGVFLRLFSGCVVMLRAPDVAKGGKPVAIEVMRPLPKLTVSILPGGSDSSQYLATSPPISMFEGERRLLRLLVSNEGPDDIFGAVIHARADKPDRICILPVDRERGAMSIGRLKRGQSNSVEVQVYALRPSSQKDNPSNRLTGRARGAKRNSAAVVSTLLVDVEYIGQRYMSHYRTSSASVNLSLAPAILIGELSLFPDASANLILAQGDVPSDEQHAFLTLKVGLLAEVANHSASPIQVSLRETSAHDDISVSKTPGKENADRTRDVYNQCFVETGGSGRLMWPLRGRLVVNSSKRNDVIPSQLARAVYDGREYALEWAIPALGRCGAVPLYRFEVLAAIMRQLGNSISDQTVWRILFTNPDTLRNSTMNMTIQIGEEITAALTGTGNEQEDDRRCDNRSERVRPLPLHRTVVTRQYYDVKISIRNTSGSPLPASSSMDVQLCQRDCRGAFVPVPSGVFVGTHSGVACGSLQPGATFGHMVRLRLSSAGLFDIVATLHNDEPAPPPAGLDERSAVAPKEADSELVHSRAAVSPPAVFGFFTDTNGFESSPNSDSRGLSPHPPSAQPSPHGVDSTNLLRARAVHILPTDGGWCPSECLMKRSSAPICVATLTLQALNDIRWSSGNFQPFDNPPVKVMENGQIQDTAVSVTNTHHSPDTIVH